MYSPDNYFWGLVAYESGALLLLICTWRLTRRVSRPHLGNLLLLLVAALLLTPVTAYRDLPDLAPAVLVATFGALSSSEESEILRALKPMLLVCGVFFTAYGVAVWGLRRKF